MQPPTDPRGRQQHYKSGKVTELRGSCFVSSSAGRWDCGQDTSELINSCKIFRLKGPLKMQMWTGSFTETCQWRELALHRLVHGSLVSTPTVCYRMELQRAKKCSGKQNSSSHGPKLMNWKKLLLIFERIRLMQNNYREKKSTVALNSVPTSRLPAIDATNSFLHFNVKFLMGPHHLIRGIDNCTVP